MVKYNLLIYTVCIWYFANCDYLYSYFKLQFLAALPHLKGVIFRLGITLFSAVSLIFGVSRRSPRALAHYFNGFFNAWQLALSHCQWLGNGCCVSGKISRHKTCVSQHTQGFQDLEVMGQMEGGEFFDRAVEVMSHSLWHVEHPKAGFANSQPRKHLT